MVGPALPAIRAALPRARSERAEPRSCWGSQRVGKRNYEIRRFGMSAPCIWSHSRTRGMCRIARILFLVVRARWGASSSRTFLPRRIDSTIHAETSPREDQVRSGSTANTCWRESPLRTLLG